MRVIKKILLIILVSATLLFSQTIWDGTIDTSWYNASQIEFTITTAGQLAGLAKLTQSVLPSGHINNRHVSFAGKTINLGNDIDLGNINWQPIGDFNGTFDGRGHSISNLSISHTMNQSNFWNTAFGLFAFIGTGGQVKNITVNITEINVESIVGYSFAVGGLAGGYSSTKPIKNSGVNVVGNITALCRGGDSHVGGLVGHLGESTEIINSFATGTRISARNTSSFPSATRINSAGGLVGHSRNSLIIKNSYSKLNIGAAATTSSVLTYVGGLIGYSGYEIEINNSFSAGDISVSGVRTTTHIGGLVGVGNRWVTINNSHTSGNIFIYNNQFIGTRIGGLTGGLTVGNWGTIIITNSYSGGEITVISESLLHGTTSTSGISPAGSFGLILNSVYFNSDLVITANNANGRSTAELQQIETFVDWDFENIWAIDPAINNGFPHLRFFTNKCETCGRCGCEIDHSTSIRISKINNNNYGIRFTQNIVSDKAEISVVLPNNERVAEKRVLIYDNTGNVVFTTTQRSEKTVWDLTNNAGRFVANGGYLVVVEVRSVNGRVYMYSAKLGVRR